jgi:hypothetical protein
MASGDGKEHTDLQGRYLEAILAESESNGTSVILLAVPIHKALREAMPDRARTDYERFLATLRSSHRVRYWDESDRVLPENAFWDPDHLSSFGARVFTRILLERLESERLLS